MSAPLHRRAALATVGLAAVLLCASALDPGGLRKWRRLSVEARRIETENRELARENERMTFVTAIVGALDLATGRLTLVDAGHNPIVLISPSGALSSPALDKHMAFGIVDDLTYTEATIQLERETTMVLYTDGATDARNAAGEQFGIERLDRAFKDAARKMPDEIVGHVAKAVERFEAGAPPEDDLTLLVLRYRGRG